MKPEKRVYNHRIKYGAKKAMESAVKTMFWQTVQALEDGAICRVTEAISTRGYDLLNESENLNNPTVYRVKLFNSKTKAEAYILPDLLEYLPGDEWIFEDNI